MRVFLLSFIAFAGLLVFGCSSSSDLTMPLNDNSYDSQSDINLHSSPVFISDLDINGSPLEGMGVMGMYSLHISRSDVELVPLRKSALEDVLESVDITNFLSLAPCHDCVKIFSISMDDDGNTVIKIGIKHPFAAGDQLKPITGKNRADLHVFNVEGIILSDAPVQNYSGIGKSIAKPYLANADGYSGYLDSAVDEIYPTDATLHPYILHFDDYSQGNFDPINPTGFISVVDPPPSGNLIMAMGCDYDYQDYVFDFAELESVDFVFAVGCSYAVSSAAKSQRFTPEYRVPQHNKKAASEVSIEIIRNDLAAGSISSDADLNVKVLDINHGVPVGMALNEMRADSSVSAILIEIPGVLSSPFNASPTPISGNGRDPVDPLTFTATITNEAAAGIGTYQGLVKVTDSYSPGLNESPLLNGLDGIKRVDPLLNPLSGLYAIDEFATYAVFSIEIGSSNLSPLVELLSSCDDVYTGGYTVLSVGPGTMDQDGNNLVLYEYDFDYDGITFDIDASNTSGDPVTTTALINETPSPINLTFALRVTDDGVPPSAGIGTLEITLHPINSNGKNIPLRVGEDVNPVDIGVNETTGEILIGFDDRQVWKYAPDYSSGSQVIQLFNGYEVTRLDVASNGYSLIWSDTKPYTTGGTSLMYTDTGSQTWDGDQGITYCAGVIELTGDWYLWGIPVQNRLMVLTNWPSAGDVRWYQMSYTGYNGYSGIYTTNLEGVGGFDSELTVAFDIARNPANWGTVWTLEAEPRYELERFSFPFNYTGLTIGLDGAQSDGMDGFNDPKDMVLDANDRIYVLEKLSNGEPVIKLFEYDGTAIDIFGQCGAIGGDPIRLDADEGDGEIHVLHSNGVSVFYESEIP